ncbi:hypothetical protein GCM10023178_27590 [Actinomadura luteofluorescens]
METPTAAGRYRIDGHLGSGGFASVWRGHDPDLDSPVAIKILAGHWTLRTDVRDRFVQEARLLRRADSHRLVQVFDIGELPDGRPYFVMTYADRGTLAERLAAGPLPPGEALRTAQEIIRGVQELHDLGIVHRDLKPSNVLLRSAPGGGERVMIADLGIARTGEHLSRLTLPVGTPGYMSPEQARWDGAPDRRGSFPWRRDPDRPHHRLDLRGGVTEGLRWARRRDGRAERPLREHCRRADALTPGEPSRQPGQALRGRERDGPRPEARATARGDDPPEAAPQRPRVRRSQRHHHAEVEDHVAAEQFGAAGEGGGAPVQDPAGGGDRERHRAGPVALRPDRHHRARRQRLPAGPEGAVEQGKPAAEDQQHERHGSRTPPSDPHHATPRRRALRKCPLTGENAP